MEEHNNTENLTPDEAVEKAKAEAEAEGKELSRIEESKIRAKASVSQQKESEEHVTEAEAAKALGIKHKAFGYSTQELQKKADGEKYSHMYLVQMIRDVISWSVSWWEQEFLSSLVYVLRSSF